MPLQSSVNKSKSKNWPHSIQFALKDWVVMQPPMAIFSVIHFKSDALMEGYEKGDGEEYQ